MFKHFLPGVRAPASDSSQMGMVAKVTASITSASSAVPSSQRGRFSLSALCVLGYRCPLRVICSLLSCCDRTAESRVWFYYCWSLGNFSQHIQEDWAQGYFCLNHQGERDLGSVPLGVIHKICIDIQLATLTPFLAKGEVCHPSYQYLRLNYLCWGRKRLPWLCC